MQTLPSTSRPSFRRLRHPFAPLLPLAVAMALCALVPAASLHAQSAQPTVTAVATQATVDTLNDSPGQIVLTLSSPATENLKIAYTLKGSAVNGRDYTALPGKARIKPGKSTATIDITPVYFDVTSPQPAKVVKLIVKAGNGYEVGKPASAKVKIISVITLP